MSISHRTVCIEARVIFNGTTPRRFSQTSDVTISEFTCFQQHVSTTVQVLKMWEHVFGSRTRILVLCSSCNNIYRIFSFFTRHHFFILLLSMKKQLNTFRADTKSEYNRRERPVPRNSEWYVRIRSDFLFVELKRRGILYFIQCFSCRNTRLLYRFFPRSFQTLILHVEYEKTHARKKW